MDITKPELDLALDSFQKQKLLGINESIAQLLINLFLMRPGNLPGLPHLGINIREELYRHEANIDTEGLKSKIAGQCSELLPGLVTDNISLVFIPDYQNQSLLIVSVGLFDNSTLNIGFTTGGSTGELQYRYEFEKLAIELQTQIGGVV